MKLFYVKFNNVDVFTIEIPDWLIHFLLGFICSYIIFNVIH